MRHLFTPVFIALALTLPAKALLAQTANALDFDGANDYVSLPTTTPVPIGNSHYTLEAWIKPTGTGNFGIIGWGNYGAGNQVNALRLNSNNLYNYWWGNDINVATPSLSGSWHHVAATFDGTTRVLYLDGVRIGSDMPGSSHAVPHANNITIGRTFNNEYFPGSIDEVRVWNRALCQAELQNNMYGELPNPAAQPGLVAYYRANQGSASGTNTGINSLTDSSASAKNGTLNNFALSGSSSNWVAGAPAISGAATPFSSAMPSSISETVTQTVSGPTTFSNCSIIASVTPTGTTTALSGSVTAKVTVDTTVKSHRGQPYVQRHYDLEPAAGASTATADITLYYTQAEFTAFNAARGTFPPLPADTTDLANYKANLRITQFHGTPTGGSAPANYPATWGGSGPAHVLITPSNVSWNGTDSRWEVTFSITGFSGFFASTGITALPVGLSDFSVARKAGSGVLISWRVSRPEEGGAYIVQRSTDASHFAAIGSVNASAATEYSLLDNPPAVGKVYYRLQIIERDGAESYSRTEALTMNDRGYVHVYPAPARDYFVIETNESSFTTATLSDMQGRAVLQVSVKSGAPISLAGFAAGMYVLRIGGQALRVVKE